MLASTGLSSANAKPCIVTPYLKQGLAQEMENIKSECLYFYKEVQAVHSLINILCAAKNMIQYLLGNFLT